jgi:hypothetical protein
VIQFQNLIEGKPCKFKRGLFVVFMLSLIVTSTFLSATAQPGAATQNNSGTGISSIPIIQPETTLAKGKEISLKLVFCKIKQAHIV